MKHDRQKIDDFLNNINEDLYRYAIKYTCNEEQAEDVVQDALLKWIDKKYYKKPQDQWRPIIYRILLNRMHDYSRKLKLTKMIFKIFSYSDTQESQDIEDKIEQELSDSIKEIDEKTQPYQHFADKEFKKAFLKQLANLPKQQQQVFSLRVIEGFSSQETADIMQISQGSVGTHLSRANAALQKKLKKFKK
jgi:RNA polymerase sigma-70 factor, ECF subfamily